MMLLQDQVFNEDINAASFVVDQLEVAAINAAFFNSKACEKFMVAAINAEPFDRLDNINDITNMVSSKADMLDLMHKLVNLSQLVRF